MRRGFATVGFAGILTANANNRLITTTTPLSQVIRKTWNSRGLVSTVNDGGNVTSYTYDERSRLRTATDLVGTSTYGYDDNNNLLTHSENGQTILRSYDDLNRLSSYTDEAGNTVSYNYDKSGNVTQITYPGGRSVTNFYDSQNRLIAVVDWAARTNRFSYDLAGRLTEINRTNYTSRVLSYDDAGQLTNIVEQCRGTNILSIGCGYDQAGQMFTESDGLGRGALTIADRQSSYDADNRLVGPQYDLRGNMTTGPLNSSTAVDYIYDSRNRLVSVGGQTNGYDSEGNRTWTIQGSQTNRFVIAPVGGAPQVLVRIRQDGSSTYYVYGHGLLYDIEIDGNNNQESGFQHFYHYDYRGNTVALSDNEGLIYEYIAYGPYGTVTIVPGGEPCDTPFLFNGKHGVQTDANGLMFMRARYYNPYLCRFVNRDPAGFEGGLNFYAYADGNPISLIDPFGLGAADVSCVGSWVHDSLGFAQGWKGASDSFGMSLLQRAANPWGAAIGDAMTAESEISAAVSDPGAYISAQIDKLGEALSSPQGIGAIAHGVMLSAVLSELGGGNGNGTVAEGTTMRNVVQFQGMEVRAVRDLSHLEQGTLQAMQQYGFAPTTVNGDSIVLHHLGQNPAGPLVEMPAANHSIWNSVQHPLGNVAGAGFTEAQRAAYNAWRTEYWQWRATQELNARRVLGH